MFSKTLLILAIFTTLTTVILSIPANDRDRNAAQAKPAPLNDLMAEIIDEEVSEMFEPSSNIGMDMQIAQERFLNNFFNLSTYLVNAPNDSAALTFVPLGSLLFGKG